MRLPNKRRLRLPTCRSAIKFALRCNYASPHRCYAKSANPYTSTIILPKTDYQLWPDHDFIRSQFITKCVDECYQWQVLDPHICANGKSVTLSSEGSLILHDGPPYANGDLHMGERTAPFPRLITGHALNKILKDIILRYNILQRRKVSYIPGWDCHGLPIELKAIKSKSERELSPSTIRNIAGRFAEKTVLQQMEEFKGWAVIGD